MNLQKNMVAISSSRVFAFDVVRVLAMFWVVTYHFGCEYGLMGSGLVYPIVNFFCITPNFDFGNVAVTMFLMLSGALLYNKYGRENVGKLSSFYIKRFKTIYPPFWILNLYILVAMFRHWFADGNLFFAGNPVKLILTLFGFDGYLQLFGFNSYYFCGEWFVGAIVILYLLFPLLTLAYNRNRIVLLTVLGVCYILQFVWSDSWEWSISVLPPTLILKFVLGFLLMDFLPKLRKSAVKWSSLLLFLALCFVFFPGGIYKNDFCGSVAGVSVFLMVLNFGKNMKETSVVGKAVKWLAPYTYCVFLLQHICINWIQMGIVKVLGKPAEEFSPAMCLAILTVTFVAILVAAGLLKRVSDWTLRFAERKFLS